MGETGLVLPKAQNWQLRGTLLIIGLATWVFGMLVIIGYTYAFFNDLADFYTPGSMFRATAQEDYIVTVLDYAIEGGLLGLCDIFIMVPLPVNVTVTNRTTHATRSPDQIASQKAAEQLAFAAGIDADAQAPGAQTLPDDMEEDDKDEGEDDADTIPDETPPTTEAIPELVNQEGCEKAKLQEERWQRAELHKDAWRIFTKAEDPVQRVFLFLDVLMIILGFLAGIIGYLVVRGAVWKRRKLLMPWLLMSFTIAYGAVLYGVMYVAVRSGFSADNMLAVGAVAAAAVLVIILHAMAFYGVAKYCAYLWRRETTPEYPVRRMGLVLART